MKTTTALIPMQKASRLRFKDELTEDLHKKEFRISRRSIIFWFGLMALCGYLSWLCDRQPLDAPVDAQGAGRILEPAAQTGITSTDAPLGEQVSSGGVAASGALPPNDYRRYGLAVDLLNECLTYPTCRTEYDAWNTRYGKETASRMALIMHQESGWNHNKVSKENKNGSKDYGFYQLNLPLHCEKFTGNCEQGAHNPDQARQVAFQIFDSRGWSAWYGRAIKRDGQIVFYADRLTF